MMELTLYWPSANAHGTHHCASFTLAQVTLAGRLLPIVGITWPVTLNLVQRALDVFAHIIGSSCYHACAVAMGLTGNEPPLPAIGYHRLGPLEGRTRRKMRTEGKAAFSW